MMTQLLYCVMDRQKIQFNFYVVMTSFDVGQLADSNLFWGVEFSNNKEHGNFNEAFEDDKHKERIQLGLYL